MGDGVATKSLGPHPPVEADDPPAPGLDQRLRERLAAPSDDPSRTWAERAAEALIAAAVRGDLRAWAVLSRRLAPAAPAAEEAATPIDDETARRVLEAVRGPVKDRSSAQGRS
ncbi:hypothetical protein [Paludisphaera soli]|uniref:hypothetical protein n=1 Tax=Paludisphaera soli TaxID=2712865 RepID=UPI0013EB3CA6|nr:hypothetical protein [Paludisphaera soli]